MTPAEFNPYAPPATDAIPGPIPDSLEPILGDVTYPLQFRFKLWTFVPQVFVTDAAGRSVLYVRQKLFKFREHVELFTDSTRTRKVAEIRANKIIDWSARYFFTDAEGKPIGEVGRRGFRSLWSAHYDAFDPGDNVADFNIREENPSAKFFDGLLGEIPLIGLLTGYLFHPRYGATRAQDKTLAMRMTKRRAFFEGRFQIEKLAELTVRQQMNLLLSFLMVVFLERRRG